MNKMLAKTTSMLGNRQLRHELARRKTRNVKYTAISEAKTIAIISDLSNDYAFNNIINFTKKISSEGKKVVNVFCTNEKEVPNFYNNAHTLIDRSMLDFSGIPNMKYIENFINTEYDFLFDFSDNDLFSVEYVFALSLAHLKVSKSSLKTAKFADVCLSLQDKNEIHDYLNAINNYLNISTKK